MRKISLFLISFLVALALFMFFNSSACADDDLGGITGVWEVKDLPFTVRGSNYDTICGKVKVSLTEYFLNDFEFMISGKESGLVSFVAMNGSTITGKYYDGVVDFVFPDTKLNVRGFFYPDDGKILFKGSYSICEDVSLSVSFRLEYLGDG